jgi:hypothetical protein
MFLNICRRYERCDAVESNSTTIEVSLMKNIPMTTSGASSITTWLTLPLAKFCLAATGIELASRVGVGVVGLLA